MENRLNRNQRIDWPPTVSKSKKVGFCRGGKLNPGLWPLTDVFHDSSLNTAPFWQGHLKPTSFSGLLRHATPTQRVPRYPGRALMQCGIIEALIHVHCLSGYRARLLRCSSRAAQLASASDGPK
jgi:hypothetical protein